MVDPNPARGMPLQLQRYWIAGKGGAKIRWGMPKDFNRCVRNLRKYFPKNPEGLCNILHQKALGAPPGKGHGHSLTASMVSTDDPKYLIAAQALIDKQPELGQYTWASPMAPIGRITGEPRRKRLFEPGSLTTRTMPRPLDWRKEQAQGHTGGLTVGRKLGFVVGPDSTGQDWAWAWGDWLNEDIVPEARRARYLVEMGVAGPSLDPGGPVHVTVNPETGVEHYTQFVVGGATLVSIPAYAELGMRVFDGDADWDDDDDMPWSMEDEDCGCSGPKAITASINQNGWKGKPLAVRETVFDNDDAVKRITAWANGDANKMREAFLYHDDRGNPLDPTSYRLPIGDIINGKLTLIFHAIYADAALLSGAHGGLPNVSDRDIEGARNVISEIYAIMAREFGDNNIRAPWDRSGAPGVQLSMDEFAPAEPYGDVKYADPGYRDNKKRYPIDTPEHIRAAWSYINQAGNAGEYTSEQLAQIKARIVAAAKKAGVQISEDSMSMTQYPLNPPKSWFENPELSGKTKLTVTDEGHVFGHLAAWNECHRDVTNRECVMAPRSQHGYEPFHLGTVVTAEGDTLSVGKIVMDTRHASINLGYTATAVHYDNTGDEIAVIRCGEDDFGIWFSGAVVPEATPQKVAKLRRSPLSGDWRRERGALELTAALAVNAPAFPIYSMEEDEVTALTAAGSVWFSDMETVYEPPPTGIIMNAIKREVDAYFSAQEQDEDQAHRDELAARLRDLEEDEEIYAQRERTERLRHMFSIDAGAAPVGGAPAPGGAQAPGAAPVQPGVAPAPEAPVGPAAEAGGQSATDAAGMDVDAWNIAAQASARYRVVRDLRDKSESPDAANPATPDTPAPAAPAPAAPPTY